MHVQKLISFILNQHRSRNLGPLKTLTYLIILQKISAVLRAVFAESALKVRKIEKCAKFKVTDHLSSHRGMPSFFVYWQTFTYIIMDYQRNFATETFNGLFSSLKMVVNDQKSLRKGTYGVWSTFQISITLRRIVLAL